VYKIIKMHGTVIELKQIHETALYGENVFVLNIALHLLSARSSFYTVHTSLEKGYEVTYKTISHSNNRKKNPTRNKSITKYLI